MKEINHESNKLIDELGGTTKAALFFDVKPPSVHGWRFGNGIPRARMQYLRAVRPDLFGQKKSKVRK